MADKTTTLKTKTNDNVYPNVIGDNMDNAISDSPQIKHTLTAEHKINFRLDTNVNNLINNSLQKPAGLTKTKLVGVGTNGQENIEIGDNLTLANGKLSATGGSSIINYLITTDLKTYTGDIDDNKINILIQNDSEFPQYFIVNIYGSGFGFLQYFNGSVMVLSDHNITIKNTSKVIHFITMKDSAKGIALYLTIQNTDTNSFTADTLTEYLDGEHVLANGNLHGLVPTYIAGEYGKINIYYRTPGDSNINPKPDEFANLSSFTISDLVSPVE